MTAPVISINRLKLARMPHGGARRLRAEVERELATLIAEKPLAKAPRSLGEIDMRRLSSTGDKGAARRIAEKIYEELSK